MSLAEIFDSKTGSDIKKEIVLELLNSKHNLDEKTELKKPIKWSVIKALQDYLEKMGLKNSAKILNHFINQSHRYLISKDRKGREEYIQALNSLSNQIEEEQTAERIME